MKQCDDRRDIILDTGVDDIVVMVDSDLVDWAGSKGQDSRPSEREGICIDADSSNACDI